MIDELGIQLTDERKGESDLYLQNTFITWSLGPVTGLDFMKGKQDSCSFIY